MFEEGSRNNIAFSLCFSKQILLFLLKTWTKEQLSRISKKCATFPFQWQRCGSHFCDEGCSATSCSFNLVCDLRLQNFNNNGKREIRHEAFSHLKSLCIILI